MVDERSSLAPFGRNAAAPSAASRPGRTGQVTRADKAAEALQAADQAYAQGDTLRARRLLAALLANKRALSAAMHKACARRAEALAVDPHVVRVGVVTALVYVAACTYARLQH